MEDDINRKNIYINSKFSKNINDLFLTEYNQYYDKNRLNIKLKSMINKEKSLNNKLIKDFNYGKMFHLFKVDMRKFEDEQNKRRTFYKILNEENLRFNQDYKNSYASKIHSVNINKADINIKSKTFQKFYNKNKINTEQISKNTNNFFNRDPLLYSGNAVNLYYLNKDLDKDYLYNNDDEALNYVSKLEQNINEKSVLNKIRNILNNKKKNKKEKKLKLDSEEEKSEDDYYSKNDMIENDKSYKDKSRNIMMRTTISNIKNYNKTVQREIDKLNDINNTTIKNKSMNKIYNLKKNMNNNKNIFTEAINKRNKTIESNQIESLYNEIVRIKKNLKKYAKKNENGLKYLYTVYSKNKGKKLKISLNENKVLFNLDRKLVYTVNSFND